MVADACNGAQDLLQVNQMLVQLKLIALRQQPLNMESGNKWHGLGCDFL